MMIKLNMKLLILTILLTTTSFASERDFNNTLEKARKFFAPLYSSNGKKLSITGEWEYDENNAKALAHTVDHYYIEIYGGALKTKGSNIDSLRAMICHEVGHHFGGAPLMPQYYEDYYLFRGSSEGQADYFATSICLKKWFSGEDHWGELAKSGYFPKDQKFCELYYSTKNEVGLCVRIITAFKKMLEMDLETFVHLNWKSPKDDYPYMLASTVIHPQKKCRLETAYAGVICQKNEIPGCLTTDAPIEASRPLCWAGIGFLLDHEFPINSSNTIKSINRLPIKEFYTDFYDDDEVQEHSKKLKAKFKSTIPALNLYK